MDWFKKSWSWIWANLGNLTWIAGIVASFALPAWAVRVSGLMAQYAPLSWVVAGFLGITVAVPLFALFAWARGKLVRTRYDARLLARGGEIDPLAKTFERKRIFLSEFVLPSKPLVEDKTFIDCEIIGPATVILHQGNTVNEHRLPICDAYVMNASANPNTGYVFNRCAFRGCSFVRVSLMFSLEEYEKAKDVNWLNWVSIRPDHLEEAFAQLPLVPESPPEHLEAESPGAKRWKLPWKKD